MVEIVVALIGGSVLLTNTYLAKKAVAQQRTANGHTIGQQVELTHEKVKLIDTKLDTHINQKNAHE